MKLWLGLLVCIKFRQTDGSMINAIVRSRQTAKYYQRHKSKLFWFRFAILNSNFYHFCVPYSWVLLIFRTYNLLCTTTGNVLYDTHQTNDTIDGSDSFVVSLFIQKFVHLHAMRLSVCFSEKARDGDVEREFSLNFVLTQLNTVNGNRYVRIWSNAVIKLKRWRSYEMLWSEQEFCWIEFSV